MPAPNAAFAPLESSKSFHGASEDGCRPDFDWNSDATKKIRSAASSSIRKTPRIFAVSSMWKKARVAMTATPTTSTAQTGGPQPIQSWSVVFTK